MRMEDKETQELVVLGRSADFEFAKRDRTFEIKCERRVSRSKLSPLKLSLI